MTRLRDRQFVDLYVGEDFADFRGEPGTNSARTTVPAELMPEVAQVRDACSKQYQESGDPEFAHMHEDVLYRVTVMHDLYSKPVFVMRRMAASIRDFTRLGLTPALTAKLLDNSTRGLILVCGDQVAGKTTTAASLLAARLRQNGGFGLAIEDPPETQLQGLHGEGRCTQVPVSTRYGSYQDQLRRAMRSGVHTLLIGEIRCADTAVEAIRQSNNGIMVVTTIHAHKPTDALSRLIALAESNLRTAQKVLADGLTAIVYQKLERTPAGHVRVAFKTLFCDEKDGPAIRTKIAGGDLSAIAQEIDTQNRSATWG